MALNERRPGDVPVEGERDPWLDLLYRGASRETPPPRLDAAILAAARREVGAAPRPLLPTLSRWRLPLSIAAVALLTVSLVTLVQEETQERFSEIPLPPLAQPAEGGGQPVPPETARREPRAAAPTTVAPERRRDGTPADRGRDAAGRLVDRAGPEGAAGEAGAPESRAENQARVLQSAPRRAEDDAFAKRPAEAAEKTDSTSGAPLAYSRRAPGQASGEPVPGTPADGSLRRYPQGAPSGSKTQPPWSDLQQALPGQWLERIEELRHQERLAEAEAILAEFKRRFPDYPVPTNSRRPRAPTN